MSGIAGVVLPAGARPLAAPDLDGMMRALDGTEAGPPLVLDQGRVALVARGAVGYDTGLASVHAGAAVVAMAFHGRLTAAPVSTERAPDGAQEPIGPAGSRTPVRELLALWMDEGPACFAGLRGEFAIAVWDGRDRSLHLATDRFRIQPLLTAERPDQLLFASRMAALLASPVPFEPRVDAGALLDVVASSVIAAPRTIFREVDKLPAAHRLTHRGGRTQLEPYWDLDFTQGSGSGARRRLEEATREALEAAVRDRLRDDAPSGRYGAFLSGGVDSTTVVGLLTRISGGPIPTFSIGFSEERFNELHYARVAARAFHSKHTEYFVTPRDTEQAMDALAESFDEPFANASAVPTYFCARVAREHGVEALYAGDGGDELFAGNQRYADSKIFEPYDRLPRWIRDPLITPAIAAAGRLVPHPLFVKAGKYVRRASLPAAERIISYDFWNVVPPRAFATDALLAEAGAYRPSAMVIRHHDRARARTALDRHLYLDLKITISDNDVPKVTRMCARAGTAVRFPFLDERVVDAAMRVPARLKMRGRELRTFFKETYRDLLPEETRAKTKHGFGLPISGWLKSDPGLNAMMRDLVLSPRSVERGYFRREALEDVVRRHGEDPTPYYGTVLWNLMMIELWHRRVLDARTVPTA